MYTHYTIVLDSTNSPENYFQTLQTHRREYMGLEGLSSPDILFSFLKIYGSIIYFLINKTDAVDGYKQIWEFI